MVVSGGAVASRGCPRGEDRSQLAESPHDDVANPAFYASLQLSETARRNIVVVMGT